MGQYYQEKDMFIFISTYLWSCEMHVSNVSALVHQTTSVQAIHCVLNKERRRKWYCQTKFAMVRGHQHLERSHKHGANCTAGYLLFIMEAGKPAAATCTVKSLRLFLKMRGTEEWHFSINKSWSRMTSPGNVCGHFILILSWAAPKNQLPFSSVFFHFSELIFVRRFMCISWNNKEIQAKRVSDFQLGDYILCKVK